MHDDDLALRLEEALPCREEQIGKLLDYIGERDEPMPECLFLYGSSATGKTACAATLLKRLNYRHAILNAVECYAQRIIYETILNALAGHRYDKATKYQPLHKCDNMKDFIVQLDRLFSANAEPVVIVIDKAEKLRDLDQNILPVFLRLKEFCALNVCVIFVSNVPFEKYQTKTGLRRPLKIFFPQYNKDELFKIIMSSQAECSNFVVCKNPSADVARRKQIQRSDVFANYLNAFLSVFYRPCRDLVELKYMARMNYVKYCEPILNGSIDADDITKLWRNIGPVLKTSLEMLYLRLNMTNYSANFAHKDLERGLANLDIKKDEKKITDELTSVKTFAQNFELPFYAKYLLIAAYLASFNPVKEDKRLFMKYHGKQRKRMQQVNAKAKISDKMATQLGPKTFTLDRLLAIFYAIIEERVGLTANLLVQISSLVSLRLLTASSDSTKYKCTVSYEFIVVMARMVGFDIRKYLYDFI